MSNVRGVSARMVISKLSDKQFAEMRDKAANGLYQSAKSIGRAECLEDRKLARAMNEAYFNLYQLLAERSGEKPDYCRKDGGVALRDGWY